MIIEQSFSVHCSVENTPHRYCLVINIANDATNKIVMTLKEEKTQIREFSVPYEITKIDYYGNLNDMQKVEMLTEILQYLSENKPSKEVYLTCMRNPCDPMLLNLLHEEEDKCKMYGILFPHYRKVE